MPDPSNIVNQSSVASAENNRRRDRLKLALRENLKRRKSQARGRQEVLEIDEHEIHEVTDVAELADGAAGRAGASSE